MRVGFLKAITVVLADWIEKIEERETYASIAISVVQV